MPIKVICVCGKKFSVIDELAGRKVKCPACDKVLNLAKATAEKLSPNDQRDFEVSANDDSGNGRDQALEQFVGMMSSGAEGSATSQKKSTGKHAARRKKEAVSEPFDPCSSQLLSVRASKVREGISCYFFGFLVIFFLACWGAYAQKRYARDLPTLIRVLRGTSVFAWIAEAIMVVGFGLCLTASSKIRRRDSLLVALVGGVLGLVIGLISLWNPLYSMRIGPWLPQFVLLTTHAAYFLFLLGLGDFLGRREIVSRATWVLVLLAMGAVIWLGVFHARLPMPTMMGRNAILASVFVLVLLFAVGIMALIGLFTVIRLLSRCREILRTDDRDFASSKAARKHGSADREANWLSRSDLLKLAIGSGLAAMSLWGWMAFYKPTPVGLAALSGIPAFAPAKPKIETRPGMTLLTLAGHTGMVSNVSFNSDWTRLATASWDKTIKVWDAKSAKELLTLAGHTEPVRRVTFSPDGMWLASASADKSVKLWDAFGGKEQRTLTGHTAAVVSVAFSPDGKRLASVSDDKTVKVWNVSTGRELLNLAGHTTPINAVAFSPDGQRLASAETNVKVWDVRSGQELVTLKGHTAIVGALAFRSDGQQLATGGFDTTVKLWDINSGKESQTLRGHQSMVQGLAYRADGSGLFSLGVDRKLKEWDLASGKLRRTIQSASSVSGLTLSSDGKRIAATGMMGAVEIWNELLDQPAPAHSGHAGAVMSVAFSPDSQWIASGSADQTIKLWSAATGQEKQTLKDHAGTVSAVAFRADDKSLVTVVSGFGQKGQAKVWDLGSGLDTHKFAVDFTGIIAMNAEGTRLASAFPDYSVKVWDLENERELSALKGHSGFLSSLALSRDGTWMASAGRVLGKPGAADYLTKPGEIRVWNISTGQESRLLGGQTAQVEGVAISPDGKRLASSHHDTPVIRNGAVYLRSILKLWDAQSGQELHAHNKTAAVASRHLLFSRDGKHLAAANSPAGNDITLFDAATGQELRTLKGHTQAVSSLDFSPDGKRLASASNDETVKVWDTTTGRELLMLGVPAQ